MTRVANSALATAVLLAASLAGVRAEQSDASLLGERRAAIAAKSGALSAADVAKEHFALGVWAKERNLVGEARAEFQAAVAADPSHEPAHAALGDARIADAAAPGGTRWVPYDEAMAAKGLVRRDDVWVLREEAAILDQPATEKARRREEHAKTEKLLRTYASGNVAQRKFAEQALGAVDDKYKVEPFAYALRSASEDLRVLAAKELGRLGNRRALAPLVRRALVDPSSVVREAALDAAKTIGDANLVAPFVKALESDSSDVRQNAARGIARIGDMRGVKFLIWRLEAHGGSGQRVFAFFGNQLSYIQDFDVEVAQTAFIADPQVGVIQEGIVLDVQIHSLDRVATWAEREVFHGSLVHMTEATGVKNEPGAWAAWWKEHGADVEKRTAAK
ncbi:MAG: HEAT repeat domain-containing protein [Planctomycetes bacterium]|nr:HEAT repeat domain-containing protein [Planctomycetota bacterium]